MIYIFKRKGCSTQAAYRIILNYLALLAFLLITTQSFASDQTLDQKISLNVNDVQLGTILKEIKNQTNFDFVCSNDINGITQKISLNVTNASVDDIMTECLKGSGYTHKAKGEIIVIVKKAKKPSPKQEPRKTSVKGTVTDEEGIPIPGVNIIVVENNTGTITDINGAYEIKVPAKKATLYFTFIGFQKQMIKVDGKTEINIQLKTEVSKIGDVIVTGMEVVKKIHLTGVATVLDSHVIQDQGISSVDQILNGKIVGLNSTNLSGEVGTRSKITIRGENSLTGNTEPLWILDG